MRISDWSSDVCSSDLLGATLVLHNVAGTFADRVMLVGLGRERNFDEAAFRKVQGAVANALRQTGAIDVVSYLTHLTIKNRDFQWNIAQALLATEDVFYRSEEHTSELQSLMRISYAVFCLTKKKRQNIKH